MLFLSREQRTLLPPCSLSEISVLVSFMICHKAGNTWPSRHGSGAFWDSAGRFIVVVLLVSGTVQALVAISPLLQLIS